MSGWVAGAVVVGGVISAVGSNMAANTQADAQKQAAQTQQNMYNTTAANEQPYMTAGNSATQTLSQLTGGSAATGAGGTAAGTNLQGGYLTQTFNPSMSSLEQTPGYQFALDQGGQAVTNQNTPGSGALSGAALKSLTSFNQGLASTQYQNSFNNFQTQQNNIFNRLSSIAGLGQNAAGNLGNNGAQLGTGVAQAQAAAGASTASGISSAGSSIGNSVALAGLINGNSNSTAGTINDPTSGAFSAQTGTTSGTAYNDLYGSGG